MATELVLLGTAGAPMPVAGRAGISSALIVDDRVFVVDCGRGSIFMPITPGDLPGMLIYPWGVRLGEGGPLPPIRVYGPARPKALPTGDVNFHRQTTIHPELPGPGATDLVNNILAAYAYHLNIMPLDAAMPDPGVLVKAVDIHTPRAARAVDRSRSSSSRTRLYGSAPWQ